MRIRTEAKKVSATDEAIGCRTGGLNYKMHVPGDARGNPTAFPLTDSQEPDRMGANKRILPRSSGSRWLPDQADEVLARVREKLKT